MNNNNKKLCSTSIIKANSDQCTNTFVQKFNPSNEFDSIEDKDPNNIFIFTFSRNPISRYISAYSEVEIREKYNQLG